MGSLAFSERLLQEVHVAVSPGCGFGSYGNDHVRFALIENEQRLRQAFRSMKKLLSGADLPVDGV